MIESEELESQRLRYNTSGAVDEGFIGKLFDAAQSLQDQQMLEAALDFFGPHANVYYRGNDDGVRGILNIWRRVIDGDDDGSGMHGNPEIDELRLLTRDLMIAAEGSVVVAQAEYDWLVERSHRLEGLEL